MKGGFSFCQWGLGALLLLALATPAGPALAGLVVIEGQGESRSSTSIQANRLRYEDSGQVTIFDLNQGTMILLQPARKRYWTGTPEEFARQVKTTVDAQLDAELKALPPEERQALKDDARRPALEAPAKVPVRVERSAQVDTLAGHPARKHQIFVEGQLLEEVWIAEDLDLSKELDPDKYAQLLLQTRSDDTGDWEFDPQVRALRTKGVEMKSIRHAATGPEESGAVQKVEQKQLPDSTFQVPAGYQKATMAQILE
jgi:hypothetical protein